MNFMESAQRGSRVAVDHMGSNFVARINTCRTSYAIANTYQAGGLSMRLACNRFSRIFGKRRRSNQNELHRHAR